MAANVSVDNSVLYFYAYALRCLQLTLQVRTIASAMVRLLHASALTLILIELRQTAVSRGDLTQKIAGLTVSGEMLELVNTINDMFVQLVIFAREIKKVTRGVGIEGMRLGVQAEVGNVQGIWQEIMLVITFSDCSPCSTQLTFIDYLST